MSSNINILDKEYLQWVRDLGSRYRRTQIKAAVKVNQEVIRFHWELGRDISEMGAENKYGSGFYATLSRDMKRELPDVSGLSETAIRYSKRFYELYRPIIEEIGTVKNLPQVVEEFKDVPQTAGKIIPQPVGQSDENPTQQPANQTISTSKQNLPQVGEEFTERLFSVPWGHHKCIIDKCSDNPHKAVFYVQQTVENGWSRSMLLNFLDADLYGRQGKAQTNFSRTLPDEMSELAKELMKDPYDFAFTGVTDKHNEHLLKDALLNNITQFLIELGTGFAYVGKEYRLQIGGTENFLDLLFYNLRLSCYVVVEVKIGKATFADAGQLSGYVVACNHILRKEGRDNPTIGLLICKEKDTLVAQYAVEASSQPLGISEYDLAALYPEKVEGTIPTIEEIETKLANMNEG